MVEGLPRINEALVPVLGHQRGGEGVKILSLKIAGCFHWKDWHMNIKNMSL